MIDSMIDMIDSIAMIDFVKQYNAMSSQQKGGILLECRRS